MSTEIAQPQPAAVRGGDPFTDPAAWEQINRVGKAFAASALVPEHFRGKLADTIVAVAMAQRIGENPLIVLQNIHIVKGKAGWSAQYMIARANASGLLRGRIRWDIVGKGDNLAVTAKATLADTGEEVTFTASMEMARAEKWTDNPKYRSMPELMLRYRSATFLVRLYLPEIMLGYQTAEELEDVGAAAAPKAARAGGAARPADYLDAVDVTPALPEAAIYADEGPARETVAVETVGEE